MTMEVSELACVYAALILADDDVAITGDKIATIVKAAGVDVEPYWPGLYAKALEGVSIRDLITCIGSGVGVNAGPAAPAAAPAAGGDAPPVEKKEEKKAVESSESDDDMGFGLFD